MLAAAADLVRFPRMGRIAPEWNQENVRERIVYSYRLIYRIDAEHIVILAVIHGARLLPVEIQDRG